MAPPHSSLQQWDGAAGRQLATGSYLLAEGGAQEACLWQGVSKELPHSTQVLENIGGVRLLCTT